MTGDQGDTSAPRGTGASSERVTIRDLARACGVAVSTVSNALAGQRFVAPETRQRILAMAEKMGYRASTVARSLRLRRTWTIGILVGDITNPFFPELVRGAEDVAAAENYNLILCNTDYRPEKQDAYLRLLADKQIDGLILASQVRMSKGIVDFAQSSVPLVMINQRHADMETDYVGVDNNKGLQDVCQHLWELGHRRIAFICGREGSTAAADRYSGFVAAMEKLSGKLDARVIEHGDYSYASGVAGAKRLLAMIDRPTAIVAANDLMALGAMEAVGSFGLRVPEDVSVCGIDDIFVASLPWINLTTLRQPKWNLGVAAARLVLERMKVGPGKPNRVIIDPEFVQRGTTAPVGQGQTGEVSARPRKAKVAMR